MPGTLEALRVVFVILLGLLILPFGLALALLVALDSGLPVLYRQRRIGKTGKPFLMYKFRTMVVGAEQLQNRYRYLNEADGPVFKIHDDPRFTKMGRFLSHTGLDELPQFINILKGEMALVGPRPLPLVEAAKLQPWQQQRDLVKPGIISPWIFAGYHSKSFSSWMESDIAYARHKNVGGDIALFLRACRLLGRLLWQEIIKPPG